MLKVEHLEVWGFEHAIRGMRNPMNSWDKSDSWPIGHTFELGPADLTLMQKLYSGGTEHRKFMRQIFVSLDITAPLYWWKEFDTYKVGTVANSCSTMHKITAKEFVLDDFSHEHLLEKAIHSHYQDDIVIVSGEVSPLDHFLSTIQILNHYRKLFLQTNNKDYWWQLIQLLPSSYNQKRTITMTYENAAAIVHQREYHKQDEWREELVPILLTELPNFGAIIGRA